MFRPLFCCFGLLFLALRLVAMEPARDPALAGVRIESHGASGTIIASGPGKSWVLSCAHMFEEEGKPSPALREKPLVIDGPVQVYAEPRKAAVRLLACDHVLDLSLIEIDHGPFHYIPVAPPGHQPGPVLWSCGYDNMDWPITKRPASIVGSGGNRTYTREKPWHGRSGGGLIDGQARRLIGVVRGYEIVPGGRGVYISHEAILKFMDKQPNPPRQECDPLPLQKQDITIRMRLIEGRCAIQP